MAEAVWFYASGTDRKGLSVWASGLRPDERIKRTRGGWSDSEMPW